jgi:quercetin dioxygenase-like cupin family protein
LFLVLDAMTSRTTNKAGLSWAYQFDADVYSYQPPADEVVATSRPSSLILPNCEGCDPSLWYTVAYVQADPGYVGDPHEHAAAEFFYLVDGTLRNQGRVMKAGDGYAAAAGSKHSDFTTDTGATYVVIFKLSA